VVRIEYDAGGSFVQDAAPGVGVDAAASQAFEMGAQAAEAVRRYAAHLLEEEDVSAHSGVGSRKAGSLEEVDDQFSQRLDGNMLGHGIILTGIEVR
jgi:hypothetical protein